MLCLHEHTLEGSAATASSGPSCMSKQQDTLGSILTLIFQASRSTFLEREWEREGERERGDLFAGLLLLEALQALFIQLHLLCHGLPLA